MSLDLWLVSFIVVSNAFWAYQVHVMMNKLMSKSFYEYKFTKDGPPKVEKRLEENDDSVDQEQDILDELNGMLPK